MFTTQMVIRLLFKEVLLIFSYYFGVISLDVSE
jgi:hypothetical protein